MMSSGAKQLRRLAAVVLTMVLLHLVIVAVRTVRGARDKGAAAQAEKAAALLLARPLSKVFVGYDQELMEMTVRGFVIYSLSFLLCGFNIFGSSLFTALNNGLISAVISFVRTLICQIAAVLLLPLIFGLDGIWWAIVVSEAVALILTVFCFVKFKERYHYL